MERLDTIQKSNNLNTLYRDGEAGPGRACHDYVVSFGYGLPEDDSDGVHIRFQCGPRKEPESMKGVLDGDLLEIVRDRLRAFQSGPYSCRENACALTHIEEALMWLSRRAEDRAARNVLGTYNK